jgi:hypothetical protein
LYEKTTITFSSSDWGRFGFPGGRERKHRNRFSGSATCNHPSSSASHRSAGATGVCSSRAGVRRAATGRVHSRSGLRGAAAGVSSVSAWILRAPQIRPFPRLSNLQLISSLPEAVEVSLSCNDAIPGSARALGTFRTLPKKSQLIDGCGIPTGEGVDRNTQGPVCFSETGCIAIERVREIWWQLSGEATLSLAGVFDLSDTLLAGESPATGLWNSARDQAVNIWQTSNASIFLLPTIQLPYSAAACAFLRVWPR